MIHDNDTPEPFDALPLTDSDVTPAGMLPATPASALKQSLAAIPQLPGVYRYFDSQGNLLYVGKSKSLRKRVSSYFQKQGKHESPRTEDLVRHIAHIAVTQVNSEHEALLLEDNLIKAHHPPYNILLRDDKRYPWVCITGEPFPRVLVTRGVTARNRAKTDAHFSEKPASSKADKKHRRKPRYFGPYSRSADMYDLLRIIRKHFPVRQRKTPLFKDRPCMNYSIGTCPGPCQNLIDEDTYEATIQQIILLLKGHLGTLLDKLEKDMEAASEALNFEWAAQLRDRYQAVDNLKAMQQVVHLPQPKLKLDVIGLAHDDTQALWVVWQVRNGRVVGTATHRMPLHTGQRVTQLLTAFLSHLYAGKDASDIPDELLLPVAVPTKQTVTEAEWEDWQWLTEGLNHQRRHSQPRIKQIQWHHPVKGTKATLLQQANTNAHAALDVAQTDALEDARRDSTKVLAQLQEQLNLPALPKRMECYDISHVQGSHTVASMVVFTNGQPDTSQYRRFNIKTAEGSPDDFASMAEAMQRRSNHLPSATIAPEDIWPTPDLIIIDGGKGQLSSARTAMEANGMGEIATVSLAKRLEEVFVPNESKPIRLPRDSASLYMLQHIRDEAHRFAITHHRKRRGVAATQSQLAPIPGVGPKRHAKLLATFGTFEALKTASAETIARNARIPKHVAQHIWEYFQQQSDENDTD